MSVADPEPAYMSPYRSGMLRERAEQAISELNRCRVCPRLCDADRLRDRQGVCKVGRYARVASYGAHFGEEDCLRGWRGSGTIFFSMCNLRCVFCQNYDISQQANGVVTRPERLADIMMFLQAEGCHNINLVTPEHVVPQILEALCLAVDRGLRLPIVYNTSAYDSLDSLALLNGVVDIYMPDFKLWDPTLSLRYLKARDYPETARAVIREMHRQVGPLVMDKRGLARRGVLVRHLVMPGLLNESRAILRFLAEEISDQTYVNIMDQYYPAGKVNAARYVEINRRLRRREYDDVVAYAGEIGLCQLDERRPIGRYP